VNQLWGRLLRLGFLYILMPLLSTNIVRVDVSVFRKLKMGISRWQLV
jgi:hypothetical protein